MFRPLTAEDTVTEQQPPGLHPIVLTIHTHGIHSEMQCLQLGFVGATPSAHFYTQSKLLVRDCKSTLRSSMLITVGYLWLMMNLWSMITMLCCEMCLTTSDLTNA